MHVSHELAPVLSFWSPLHCPSLPWPSGTSHQHEQQSVFFVQVPLFSPSAFLTQATPVGRQGRQGRPQSTNLGLAAVNPTFRCTATSMQSGYSNLHMNVSSSLACCSNHLLCKALWYHRCYWVCLTKLLAQHPEQTAKKQATKIKTVPYAQQLTFPFNTAGCLPTADFTVFQSCTARVGVIFALQALHGKAVGRHTKMST